MADINTAVLKIKNGMKITSSVMKSPLPDGITADENTEIHKIMINGQEYYNVRRITGPLSQDTKRDYIVFLKRFYLWAIDEGYCNLSADKIKKIKPPAANKATKTAEQMLTKDEVMRMIKACNGETGTRDKAMLSVLYEAGLRINELAGLQWSDLKFEGPFIKINVCSKTGIPRYVPLTASREYLSAWRDAYPDGLPEGDKPVFVTTLRTVVNERGLRVRRDTYKTLTYAFTKNHIQRIAARANIEKKVTCHLFRHSRATALLQDGYPESTIKMMLWGSLSSDMLSHYAHLCNNDVDAVVARASGISIDTEEIEDPFKPRISPQCHSMNAPTSGFCNICGAPLTKEIAVSLEQAREEIHADPRYDMALDRLQQQIDALAGVLGTKS